MNAAPLGIALMLAGLLFFVQGRLWHERAAGARLGSGWQRLPKWLRQTVCAEDVPPAIAALPAQGWGAAALIAGLILVVGLVQSGNGATTIAFLLFVPGVLVMGVLTLLLRLLPP